ncbi:MAG: lipopolysaccharide transport periplasmic protein LptA [Gammaproteobacteria bacterium]|nr:MAG: lipopolysaccharide transport periplasmic protein LptA [Gammaproteobacteria bacterium]
MQFKISKILQLGALGLLAVTTTSSIALPSDASQPVRLLADKATYRASTGVTTYSGNVIITQGTLKMRSSDIVVNLSKKGGISSAIARGHPATIQQIVTKEKGMAKGQANKIEYNSVTGIITLTGNAKLSQNGASFSGNVLRYSLKAGDVEATGGSGRRVELVFPPNGNVDLRSVR